MEMKRILRSIKYLTIDDIKRIEDQIKIRKEELGRMIIRRDDTVELFYPEDHMANKLNGKHVKIEGIDGERYITTMGSKKFAFPKSRIKRVVKRGGRR